MMGLPTTPVLKQYSDHRGENKVQHNRLVTSSAKDTDGDIAGLCGSFGEVGKATAIRHIESGTYNYFVTKELADIHVVSHPLYGKYLRTDPDKTTTNNLDELPDC